MVSSTPVLDIEEDFYASGCQVHDTFKRYFTEDVSAGGQLQIHLHSNGLCYLTLGPNHPIIKDNYVIKSVEFSTQRLNNQVSGKRKRGSQSLQANSNLATVTTECGKTFIIKCSMSGKLAEVNKRLIDNPQEIKSPYRGYFAIFMTKFSDNAKLPSNWTLKQEENSSAQS